MFRMPIGKLRDVAAFLGVESPTTLSKSELVEVTYKAKCGVDIDNLRVTRGRPTKPPKGDYSIDWDKVPERNWTIEQVDESLGKFVRANDNIAGYETQEANDKNVSNENSDFTNIMELGYLEIMEDGYGFTRSNFGKSNDAYVSLRLIRSVGLRKGDVLTGTARAQFEGKPYAVVNISRINGMPVAALTQRPRFDELTPIYPDQMLRLEKDKTKNNDITMRMIDLVCPIGKGQRALIVAPPKAGKTTIIKNIASNIMNNNPDIMLFTLLIDERPEEVTDMQRSVPGEVVYSTFDETAENHIKVAEMLIERAKRQVEIGRDVVIIMDSLTRLARAYNTITESSGKTLSGGIDPRALHFPKKFFGSARNIEHGGSLTIIATALVETGSRMDDVIFEEFKGTGNLELRLDRKLSEKRIFPAIDLDKSSTRRDDLLLSQKELEANIALRALLANNEQEATK
ncbi:MAG: transcription termination factor Rho, partial [Clostridia bacterium]|nr:transcription termination factor Rho [Clostridia bacterium]